VAACDVGKSVFVVTKLRELSVRFCKGNYLMHLASLGVLAGEAPGLDSAREQASFR
jgi:hypothetical protein